MKIKIIVICFMMMLCQIACQNAYTNKTKCVENVVQPENSKTVKDLRDIILCQEWRLFSLIFSVMPSDGFPIEFRASGEVATKNLSLVKTWTIAKNRTLDFYDSSGNKIYIFKYIEKEKIFVHTMSNGGMKGNIIVIAPRNKSFDLLSYCQEKRKGIKNR
jgi:hypothetical protein